MHHNAHWHGFYIPANLWIGTVYNNYYLAEENGWVKHLIWKTIQFERIPDEFVGYFICLLKLRKSKKHFPQLLLSSYSCGLCNHRAQGLAVHVYSLKYKPLVFHVYHAFGRSTIILLWLLNIGLSPNRFENVTLVYHRKETMPAKKYLQNMNIVEYTNFVCVQLKVAFCCLSPQGIFQ